MKTKTIKYVTLCLAFLCVTICMISVLRNKNLSIIAMAEETTNNVSAKEVVATIENQLQEEGTSILEELQSQKAFYSEELENSITSEEASLITAKLNAVEEALEDFPVYANVLPNGGNEYYSSTGGESPYVCGVSPNCTCGNVNYSTGSACYNCMEYIDLKVAVWAISCGFNARGWTLAADLLWQNRTNTVLDIEYWPALGGQIAASNVISNIIAVNNDLARSYVYADGQLGILNGFFANIIDGDTFNALGNFWYSKTDAGNGKINLSIVDRYDWDEIKNNDGSASVFNKTLYKAQQAGLLTPFYTRIELTISGYVPYNWRYIDSGVEIIGVANNVTTISFPKVHDLRMRAEKLPEVNIVSIYNNAFENQSQIASVELPNKLERICSNAFKGCSNLSSISIPASVNSIGDGAFSGCNNLSEVHFYSYTVPEIGEGAFPSNISIYVPQSAKTLYENAFTNYSANIMLSPIEVDLVVDGQIYSTINTYYGAIMSNVNEPNKEGFIFDCWEDEQGKEYRNGDKFDSLQNITLTAKWIEKTSHVVTFDKQGGSGGVEQIGVVLGDPMPQGTSITAPTRKGYIFKGYFSEQGGSGKKYYNESMQSQSNWDVQANMTLYAHWEASKYTVTLDLGDGRTESITVQYGQPITVNFPPSRTHYKFLGYYSKSGGQGVCYIEGAVQKSGSYYYTKALSTGEAWQQDSNGVLYAHWEKLQANVSYNVIGLSDSGNTSLTPGTISIVSGVQTTLTAPTKEGHTFHSWIINGQTFNTASVTYTFRLHTSYLTGTTAIFDTNNTGSATYSDGNITLYYDVTPSSCVAEGTLITLSDGRQVPVETLTGNETLLVWNLHTGSFDVAPILFIDHDPARTYKIINLYFSDGTRVKVIDEHAFWDFDLNKYVFLREDASQYIGHWFNKQTTDQMGNLTWTRVQLTNVIITEEYTTAWSPVTYGHLCIYVNGMLSMPGATTGLINIFEVDGQTMQIDQQQYLADIEAYGLFTYEEFSAILSVPEEIFNAVNGQYLKVSIGKGLIDYQTLEELINNYSEFF